MSQFGYWNFVLSRIAQNLVRLIERRMRPFLDALESWMGELLSRRLPPQWREELGAYLDSWEPQGFTIKPEHRPVLEKFIERWATSRKLLPLPPGTGQQPTERRAVSTQTSFRTARGAPAGRPTQQDISERFFNEKLVAAEGQLQEIQQVLDALALKLDAAALRQEVDVEADVDAVEAAIWCYNDALESARAAWLRDDLDSSAMMRLYSMSSPLSFGQPPFLDEQQAERARRQELRINERLRERNLTMDRVVLGMQIVEGAGTAAGILLGGGVVLAAYKKGGKWAVVKTLAAAGAAFGAEEAVAAGARAAGVDEQTVQGFTLAISIVRLILLRRLSRVQKAGAAPGPKTSPLPRGTGLVPTATVPLGDWGEIRLKQVLNWMGFKPSSPYKTSMTWRYIDRLVNRTGHEAKAGLNVGLTTKIRQQALKDAELIEVGKLDGAHWHFFQGAQPQLLSFLTSLGIQYTVH